MRVKKAAGYAGAYVTDVSLVEMSADTKTELEQALFAHGVLFFRDQALTAVQMRELALEFGEIESHPAYNEVEGAPGVQILESTADAPTKIEKWHSDMTFTPRPPSLTFLHAQILPEWGGDTLWANTTAAYLALSEPMRSMLAGLNAVHDFSFGFQESIAEPGGYERFRDAIRENPALSHPLIRTHPVTQQKSLYVNELFTVKIEGMGALESKAILNMLYAQVIVQEFTVRLQWEKNTLVIWDNRITQHKPINDYFPQHRRLHRVTVCGEQPV
jgi:taurine dioxygenase